MYQAIPGHIGRYTQGGAYREDIPRVEHIGRYTQGVYTREATYLPTMVPYYLPTMVHPIPPWVYHTLPHAAASRTAGHWVHAVYSDEALGSTGRITLGERLSGASLLSVVLQLLCPDAQSPSALPRVNG